MNEQEQTTFLREGIKRYGDAMATLGAFREGLQGRLAEYLEHYEHPQLRPTQSEPEFNESNNRGGFRISTSQEAKGKDGKVWVELGLWWEGSATAMFASLWTENDKRHRLSTLPKNHPIVKPQLFGSNRWRFFASISSDSDLEATAKVLLDELAVAQ